MCFFLFKIDFTNVVTNELTFKLSRLQAEIHCFLENLLKHRVLSVILIMIIIGFVYRKTGALDDILILIL